MSQGDHERGKGLAIGAAIGAVVGVVTGILFAPKSGKETREDIKVAAHKAKEKFLAESDKIHEELSELIKNVEELAREKGSLLADKVKVALAEAKTAKKDLSEKAKQLKAGKDTSDKDLQTALEKAREAQAALAKFLKK
jgi:gas vesicle protein